MLRVTFSILFLSVALTVQATPSSRLRAPVMCYRVDSDISGKSIAVSDREEHRLERFLTAVFPAWKMERLLGTREQPTLRRATYSIVEQNGERYMLVGYTGRWTEAVNVFAMYRFEHGAPRQVWRSRAWEANYYRLSFQSATLGRRTVVLFEEGGATGEFALASVFTFENRKDGIEINDLTPSLPWLMARTHFPFRPLYGQDIVLRWNADNLKELTLSASDAQYEVGLVSASQLERTWKYIPRRNRFEKLKERRHAASQLTRIGD